MKTSILILRALGWLVGLMTLVGSIVYFPTLWNELHDFYASSATGYPNQEVPTKLRMAIECLWIVAPILIPGILLLIPWNKISNNILWWCLFSIYILSLVLFCIQRLLGVLTDPDPKLILLALLIIGFLVMQAVAISWMKTHKNWPQ